MPNGILKPIVSDELMEKIRNFGSIKIPDLSMASQIKPIEFPDIPPIEERMKFLTDRIDKSNEELKNQTEELQHLRYENKKLNAQIETQNRLVDKQLNEIEEQKSINRNLQTINDTLRDNNKHSFRNGILIGLIPGAIILVATVILTYFGWL